MLVASATFETQASATVPTSRLLYPCLGWRVTFAPGGTAVCCHILLYETKQTSIRQIFAFIACTLSARSTDKGHGQRSSVKFCSTAGKLNTNVTYGGVVPIRNWPVAGVLCVRVVLQKPTQDCSVAKPTLLPHELALHFHV